MRELKNEPFGEASSRWVQDLNDDPVGVRRVHINGLVHLVMEEK